MRRLSSRTTTADPWAPEPVCHNETVHAPQGKTHMAQLRPDAIKYIFLKKRKETYSYQRGKGWGRGRDKLEIWD